ncbi:MAG: efflux RND transporter periplasmic adaptor subunit [Candidatus Eiseniibacteriota bacterium]|jgi:membrane fusion protein (multidrug efflux system)
MSDTIDRRCSRFAGLIAMIVVMVAAGCGGGGGADQGAGAQAAQSSRGRPEQPPAPVAIATATSGDIASHYAATASLAAEREAEILARVEGVAGAVACEEGDTVRQGQELLSIDNDAYRLRLAQAEAQTANLAARYERVQGMLAKDLVAEEEAEQVKADLRAARAAEDLARLDVTYTRVTAPFAGVVVRRLVDSGQNVTIGQPLFVIADLDPLLARVHVPAREFRQLRTDQPVELWLDSTGRRLTGHVTLVSPVIDPQSGTIKVTIEVPGAPPDTRPGDFAEVRIVTERRTGTTLVPKIAVVTDRGDQVVFVAADSTAERRVVEIGFQDADHAEILSGVAPGEPVVVKGQRSLKHGAAIRILEVDGRADG